MVGERGMCKVFDEEFTNQDRKVIQNTRSRVKIITKLTNFIKQSQTKECSGE